jgi:hypothetical protein
MQTTEMNLSNYPQFPQSGVVEGVYYGQNPRVDELNDRMYVRNLPDLALAPNYDPRPTPTKRSQFPMVNIRATPTVPLKDYTTFSTNTNFYPGTQNAPPVGYAANVETENRLRNQYFALQHSDQNVYVPSADSDLYKVTVVSRPSEQPHPDLFAKQSFSNPSAHDYLSPHIGQDIFFNNTRTQLRNTLNN